MSDLALLNYKEKINPKLRKIRIYINILIIKCRNVIF